PEAVQQCRELFPRPVGWAQETRQHGEALLVELHADTLPIQGVDSVHAGFLRSTAITGVAAVNTQ
ncbi:hypothetical protein D8M30_10885, partial [Corynebacterium pseudodiphtheriticum]